MALPRLIVLVLAAMALAGCCASGTGCPVTLPPDLATSDGLVTRPEDNPPPVDLSMGKKSRSRAENMTEPGMETSRDSRPNSKRSFEEQEAADQAADAELTRRLKICNGCGSTGRDTMATDSMSAGRTAGTSRAKTRDTTADTVD